MRRPVLAVIAASLPVLLAYSADAETPPRCDPLVVEILSGGSSNTFTVEIADDPDEQARGLMFRPALAADAGMLFVYDPPSQARFWMRNTMIPLDMIFIDDTGRIESIAERRDTYSDRVAASEGMVRAVLEINGGLSRELGIGPGAQAVHAVFRAAPEGFRCPE